jgi:hypothetical protein
MTRIFKMVLIGATLVGLLLAPLGIARADEVGGGANGTDFKWTILVPGPTITQTINGQPYTVGGDNPVGTLRVFYQASDWKASHSTAECPPGKVGKTISLAGKTPGALLKASFTPMNGQPTELAAPPVSNNNPTVDFSLCVGI